MVRPKKVNNIEDAVLDIGAWFEQQQNLGLGVNSEWVTEDELIRRVVSSIHAASDNTQGKIRDDHHRVFRLCNIDTRSSMCGVEVGLLETNNEYKNAVKVEVEKKKRDLEESIKKSTQELEKINQEFQELTRKR